MAWGTSAVLKCHWWLTRMIICGVHWCWRKTGYGSVIPLSPGHSQSATSPAWFPRALSLLRTVKWLWTVHSYRHTRPLQWMKGILGFSTLALLDLLCYADCRRWPALSYSCRIFGNSTTKSVVQCHKNIPEYYTSLWVPQEFTAGTCFTTTTNLLYRTSVVNNAAQLWLHTVIMVMLCLWAPLWPVLN